MIYTFYSYKGGVGRTHLLANVAAYLCYYHGRKVLLMDWDLEAPGLHYYFDKKDEDIHTDGLIDLLNAHIQSIRNADADQVLSEQDFIHPLIETESGNKKYIQNLLTAPNGGRIDLMPAIRYEDNYYTAIEDFDWIKFYDQLYGGSYLLWMREQLLKKEYDYVLIDSRTGFNDYSGICNVLMPDMNIVVVAPNQQNFEGAKKMVKRIIESDFTKSGRRQSFVLPVLARVEESNGDLADEWKERFAETFAFVIPEFDKDLTFGKEILEQISAITTIHYNARFAFGEKIYFKASAKPLIAGSYLENFENIALLFLEQMNQQGNINLNKLVGNKMILVYQRQINKHPEDEKAWFQLGNVYQDGFQDYAQAKEAYLKAIDLKPDDHEAWNNLGNVYADGFQDYVHAKEAFLKAIDIKPDSHEAWYNLGLVYAQGFQDYAQAKEVFLKVIDIKPDKHEAWNNLGVVYKTGFQDYAQAKEAFLKAIDIKPDKHEAWNNLGIVYKTGFQDYAQAKEAFLKVIDIKPDKHEAWNNLGNVYADGFQDYVQAKEAYLKAIDIKPDDHEAWNNLGVLYLKLTEYKRAEESFLKALEIKSDFENAYFNLACTYSLEKDKIKALEYLHKAIELDVEYKNKAPTDTDFEWLWNDKDFMALVGGLEE
jgi:tetratricopeptide (TPR) repeat protein